MNDQFERFNKRLPPKKCKWSLKPIVWMLAFSGPRKHETKIEKINMKGVKPPYVLLGNHNAFFDMSVSARATFPHVANYVVAIDGFIGREKLLRDIGCICKRKFTNDSTIAPVPESLGQLCKSLGVPVVTVICHGHHINHPFWNTRHERGVKPTTATVKQLITAEEIGSLSVDEINRRIVDELQYDDFRWQLENKIKVDCPDRAVGLEKILYQCPKCKKEYATSSSGAELTCLCCGKVWTMTEYGELVAKDGETEFSHIPDWYEWERANVRAEVESGTYSSGVLPVKVESLPNAKGFVLLGEGTMTHDMNGFEVSVKSPDGKTYTMKKPVPSLYSCHIEFEYLFKHGDCVDLNTLEDTWYVYPEGRDFSVTKMALATEELYYDFRRKAGRPCKAGLV